LPKDLLDRGRKADGNEILRGIEIILARIVNDPDESCTLRRRVRENRIELQELKILAALIPDADPEVGCGFVTHIEAGVCSRQAPL
jgi:hypothetical protein